HHRTKSNSPPAHRGGERMALCHVTGGEWCMIREERTVCGACALCQGKLWKLTLAQIRMAQSSRQERAAAIRLVTVVVSPVPIAPIPIAAVVRIGIHDARPSNHDRGLLYNHGRWLHVHWCWLHVHGLRSNHDRRWGGNDSDRQRQPKPNGHMHPSRM